MNDATVGALEELIDLTESQRIFDLIVKELQRKGVTPENIADGRIGKIKMWQGLIKNAKKEAEIHDLIGIHISPAWDTGPKWPVAQPCPVVKVTGPRQRRERVAPDHERILVLPDMQAGYFRGEHGLVSLHDEEAIDAVLALVVDYQPTKIVMVGDNMDGAEFGTYRITPAYMFTTQETINYLGTLMARLRWAAGDECEIIWIEGNHEVRLPNYMIDNARAAFTLRQANPTPEDWPVMSIPHLCRLGDQGVTYLPGYPASEYWLTDDFKIIHGYKVKAGSTAHAYLADEKINVIYGHIHRIEMAYKSIPMRAGPLDVMAASPGCLAKTTGVVPSTKGGTDLDGRPIVKPENWQQGIALVEIHPDKTWDYEQIRIRNGRLWWDHRQYGSPLRKAA